VRSTYPVLLEAVLGAKVAVLAHLLARRALQSACIIRTVFAQAFALLSHADAGPHGEVCFILERYGGGRGSISASRGAGWPPQVDRANVGSCAGRESEEYA
jgi:hypothetical protein